MNTTPKAQSLTILRYALIMIGTTLQASGYLQKIDVGSFVDVLMQMAADSMVVGPIAWGLYTNWCDRQHAKKTVTVAVQAGMAHAIATGAAPATVSPAAAQTIVKAYTPSLQPIPGKP